MNYYSTNRKAQSVSLREAVMSGLASDGGLYMPEHIPAMPQDFFDRLPELSFQEIAYEVGRVLFDGDIEDGILRDIVVAAFDFPLPVVNIHDDSYVLELYHGPTLAFKDFAARFMARLMGQYVGGTDSQLTILVATSGDTGSAVAHGFYNVPGIRVFILYPSGRVSDLQEKQLTTMGGNITALEVRGSFDDCQKMVKQALVDDGLKSAFHFGSANSINIARLFPQSFYYFYAVGQLMRKGLPIVISVPSGNVGNLTAGLIAKRMGLPVQKFIAATNANSVLTEYLTSGIYTPRASRATLSNAMDVGNPSNFVRMLELYHHSAEEMRGDLVSFSFSDEETKKAMKDMYARTGYVLDPHGAVGSAALERYCAENPHKRFTGIFLETAHPSKFQESVEDILGISVDIPERLAAYAKKEKVSTVLDAEYEDLKKLLLDSLSEQ